MKKGKSSSKSCIGGVGLGFDGTALLTDFGLMLFNWLERTRLYSLISIRTVAK